MTIDEFFQHYKKEDFGNNKDNLWRHRETNNCPVLQVCLEVTNREIRDNRRWCSAAKEIGLSYINAKKIVEFSDDANTYYNLSDKENRQLFLKLRG